MLNMQHGYSGTVDGSESKLATPASFHFSRTTFPTDATAATAMAATDETATSTGTAYSTYTSSYYTGSPSAAPFINMRSTAYDIAAAPSAPNITQQPIFYSDSGGTAYSNAAVPSLAAYGSYAGFTSTTGGRGGAQDAHEPSIGTAPLQPPSCAITTTTTTTGASATAINTSGTGPSFLPEGWHLVSITLPTGQQTLAALPLNYNEQAAFNYQQQAAFSSQAYPTATTYQPHATYQAPHIGQPQQQYYQFPMSSASPAYPARRLNSSQFGSSGHGAEPPLRFPGEQRPVVSDEQDRDPLTWKTEICRSHFTTGICEYGDSCQFAHGIHELRYREFDAK